MPTKRETEWEQRKRRERERDEHVAAHGPGCEICRAVPKRGGLHQDHNHRTGQTRGWLCHRCNRALPTWMDSRWLYKAIAYLDSRSLKATGDEPLEVVNSGADDWLDP